MEAVVGVGMLGAGFIGQMHALALRMAALSTSTPAIRPELKVLAERSVDLGTSARERFGWERVTTDWTEMAADPAVRLFVNAGPNDLHREPTIAAARAGKAVLCEKPLAGTAAEAHDIWRAVAAAGVPHMCAFMHRAIPALILAREMIRGGELGTIRHFRSKFLLTMISPDGTLSWRFDRQRAGHGALGDLGSHHIDVARFLVGEVRRVGAIARTWTAATGITDINDDAFVCVAELDGGATASFEASRVVNGRNLDGFVEVDGTTGSLSFHMERLNELVIHRPGLGPSTRMVTQPQNPYADFWLPSGIQGQHPIGWISCFAHQARHMLDAVEHNAPVAPLATLEDGYRVAEIVDAIARSANNERFENVMFR